MTFTQAAEKLGLDPHTVRHWRSHGVRGEYLDCATGPDGVAVVSKRELTRFLAAMGRTSAPLRESRTRRSRAADREWWRSRNPQIGWWSAVNHTKGEKDMPAKVKSESDQLESAIRSLYQLFEAPSRHGCSRTKTKDTAVIEKKIAIRKRELDNDAKLLALTAQLEQSRKDGFAQAVELHRRVDALMRRLQIRGVTDALRKDIEALAKEKPVLIGDECN